MEKRNNSGIDPAYYEAPGRQAWQGRVDGTDAPHLRWHQHIQCVDLASSAHHGLNGSVVLLGFACDEGVWRNKGRTGAKKGPDALRRMLANLPLLSPAQRLADAGNVVCHHGKLEEAQAQLAQAVTAILQAGGIPVLLGGGHEITYGHYRGIRQFAGHSIGLVNFDAHFDNRSPEETGPSSGTGFWQIASACQPDYQDFDYLAIGIQQASNTQALFNTADASGTRYILAKDFHAGNMERIKKETDALVQRHTQVYITIDMDVFAAAHAPGVSAPAYNGIVPDYVFYGCLDRLLASGKVVSIDIAELNPDLDIDNRTARLAATLIHHIVNHLAGTVK